MNTRSIHGNDASVATRRARMVREVSQYGPGLTNLAAGIAAAQAASRQAAAKRPPTNVLPIGATPR